LPAVKDGSDCEGIKETREGAQLMLLRRYSDFEKLHGNLQRLLSPLTDNQRALVIRQLPPFPEKQILCRYHCWNMGSFLGDRRAQLQAWVTGILSSHRTIIDAVLKSQSGDHGEHTMVNITTYEVAVKEFLFI